MKLERWRILIYTDNESQKWIGIYVHCTSYKTKFVYGFTYKLLPIYKFPIYNIEMFPYT